MAGGSKNYDVICNQYLCDFYILETGVLVLGLSSEAVLEIFLEGQEREVGDAAVDLLPSVSALYQFVQVNLGWLPAVVATRLSNLWCKPPRQEAVVGLGPSVSLRNLIPLSSCG